MPATEIIDLCDSSDSDMVELQPAIPKGPTVASQLRARLQASEKARVTMREERDLFSERCSTLEEELAEARKKLAQLQEGRAPSPPTMEQDESSSEIIRLLNYELEQVTQLSAENYAKYQNATRAIGDYKKVIETLWAAVECPVCFEPIWEPAAYTCGHLVCQGCAVDPNCAHCRVPTRGIIKVYAMRDIVRTISPLAANLHSPKKARR